ncbi:MAG TPA: ABC transporter permease [Bacteroidota bacterium]|nr:ABC transporter permease [Bacteroidota bacterium]
MDAIRTTLSEFIRDLKAQKLRTFLTVFGIIWGTVAIIVLLAFGMGFKRQLAISMHGMGDHVAVMFPGRTSKAFEGFGIGRPMSFIEDDAQLLKAQIKDIGMISAEYAATAAIRVGDNITNTSVGGVYPIYSEMRNVIPAAGGRFINDLDMRERRRVALIGNELKKLVFGESEAVGRTVYVGQVPFLVVGVMEKKIQNSSYNRRDQDRIFIPASTFASVFGATHLRNIIFTPADPRRAEETKVEIREVLGRRYKFDPTDTDAVFIWDTGEFDKFMFYFFLAFNIFMGLIGSFTLGVAGIGVANIMYIVVQERIKEIGVKRAVGAPRRAIMGQFFTETFFIIFLGSSIGTVLAVLITQALQYVPIKEAVGTPEISWVVMAVTAVVLAVIGLFAGLFPARRAANLNVVECLR